jgi:hypothetical protein
MENKQPFDEIIARLKDLQESVGTDKPSPIPLIDPTANVLSLVSAAITRQDDLRIAENRRLEDLRNQQLAFDDKFEVELDKTRNLQFQALKDLALAESNRVDAINLAESRRLDALLAAATNNVALASEKAGAQAATLAASVASSAEALRSQVATTSNATTTLITQLRESLEKRLTLVEQNQYQAGGANMQRTEGREQSQWIIGLIIGAVISVVGLVVKFWK